MEIAIDPVAITTFALALVRASAWIMMTPPFNTRVFPMSVKGIVAAAFAMASVAHIDPLDVPFDTGPFIVAVISQAVTGVGMGLLTGLMFSALQAAGSLIDTVAGYSLASIYDPLSESQNSMFGRVYQLIGVTLLFVTNAHAILVSGFLRSFEIIPIGGFGAASLSDAMTRNIGTFFVASLEIAGPVMACLFLSELTLGLLSRAAPALNVFALAFPLRVGVTFIVVGVSLPITIPALTNLVQNGVRVSLGG